ncbi:TetR/AcrR family transcriptional regulator [Niallia sp. JL1B1071]|uniref:TetR/AcrR family transcriptional regulator n=1 Tax=Niallia tiangongensis TaxID=3237105 RepID=UPI0037DDE075
MGRKTKTKEERRLEIIQTAKQLFEEKGYEATQISDITNQMGVAHGLVYHYVKSKSELLDAVVEEWAKEIVANLYELMKDSSRSAMDRLEKMFLFINDMLASDSSIINIVHQSEQEEIHKRISKAGIEMILPVFSELQTYLMKEWSHRCRWRQ